MPSLRDASKAAISPASNKARYWIGYFEHLIHAVKNELHDQIDASHTSLAETMSGQGRRLVVTEERIDEVAANVGAMRDELSWARDELGLVALHTGSRALAGGDLGALDGATAHFLNAVQSHTGPLRQANLWINHPVVIEWQEGNARLGAVNERIVEQPFVFGAIGELAPGSRILDIGGGESLIGLSLASLGHHVTVIEPAGYPFTHPNLTVVTDPLEDFASAEPFDAVILLSTIEHFGIGQYGDETVSDADLAATAHLRSLCKADGRLVLTTPYGPSAITEVERIYDRERLVRLLDGWSIDRALVAERTSPTEWAVTATELVEAPGTTGVVMIVASPA